MNTTINTWAAQYGVPLAAVHALQHRLGLLTPALPVDAPVGKSEAFVQSRVRLEASRLGMRLWRNNVGALKTEDGRLVRYGLANDSAGVNAVMKSADLIGIKPVVVTQAHVGQTLGVFLSREVKAPGWQYTGTDRERAQAAWLTLVTALGGDAAFTTGEGGLV